MPIIRELLDPPECAIRNQMGARRSVIFACQDFAALSFMSRGPIMNLCRRQDFLSCHVGISIRLYDRNYS